jgi:MFS family permease
MAVLRLRSSPGYASPASQLDAVCHRPRISCKSDLPLSLRDSIADNNSIIFRSLQGVGGAGLYSLAQSTIMEIAPPQQRGVVGTAISITLCLAFVAGPLLGGAFGSTNWRWIFYMKYIAMSYFVLEVSAGLTAHSIPPGVFAIIGWYMYWPGNRRISGFKNALSKIDVFGSIMIAAASILLVWEIQQAGSLAAAWDSAKTVSGLVISALCFVAFWLWQFWLHKHPEISVEPVFPIRLVKRRRFISALLYVQLAATFSILH